MWLCLALWPPSSPRAFGPGPRGWYFPKHHPVVILKKIIQQSPSGDYEYFPMDLPLVLDDNDIELFEKSHVA